MSNNKNEISFSLNGKTYNLNKIKELRFELLEELKNSVRKIAISYLENGDPLTICYDIKFKEIGKNPIRKLFDEIEIEENFTEQIHQTFTFLVVLAGLEYLIKKHPEKFFCIKRVTDSGFDIYSEGNKILAECFATVRANNNDKLNKDRKRFKSEHNDNLPPNWEEGYIFYYEHENSTLRIYEDKSNSKVTIISIEKEHLYGEKDL